MESILNRFTNFFFFFWGVEKLQQFITNIHIPTYPKKKKKKPYIYQMEIIYR